MPEFEELPLPEPSPADPYDWEHDPNNRPIRNPSQDFGWRWNGTRWVEERITGTPERTATTPPGSTATPPPTTTPPPPPSPPPYYGVDPRTIVPKPGGNPYGDITREMLPYPEWQSAGPLPELSQAGPFTPRRDSYTVTPFAPVPFAHDPYTASSWTDAENEPGYGASRTELRKQVEQGAANRGVLRSGMTIGNLYKNLDALSQQNFTQFDDRRFRNYSANRANAFETHQGNEFGRYRAWEGNTGAERNRFLDEFGVDRDVYDRYASDVDRGNSNKLGLYDRHATDVDRGNNYRFNAADASFKESLDRWKTMVQSLTTLGRPVE